jgi:DNA-binding transcriptional MerR regulator
VEYSIGDLSKITRISGKTLHHYHQEGLVIPSRIDKFTRHRYYDENCFNTVEVVHRFHRLGISTETIKNVLANHKDSKKLLEFMRKGCIAKELSLEKLGISQETIHAFFHGQPSALNAVGRLESSTPATISVACERFYGTTAEIGSHLATLYQACGSSVIGQPIILFHDDHQYKDERDLECCFPVDETFSGNGVNRRTLTGTRSISIRYEGFYEGIWIGYRQIIDYLNRHHLAVQSPSREIWQHFNPAESWIDDLPVKVDIQFITGDPDDPDFNRDVSRPGYGIDAQFDL